MLSEEDRETLKDGVHAVISVQNANAPFDVEFVRLRVINRGYVASQIASAENSASVIEETMDEILTLGVPFPNVTEIEKSTSGARRWIVSNE